MQLVLGLSASCVQAKEWRCIAGTGPTLRQSIERAAPGDTLRLSGSFREGSLTLDKPLALLGEPGSLIDGLQQGDVLTITADGVTVEGLTITGTKHSDLNDHGGIKVVECSGARILRNRVERCFFGIYLSGARDAVVERNTVRGDSSIKDRIGNAIHLWKCARATVEDNTAMDHRDGIYFEFVTDSRIMGNVSQGNVRYGLHFMFSHRDDYEDNLFSENGAGVAVMFSHHIAMRRNRFTMNLGGSAYGLLLKEINDGVVEDNDFADNTTGIMLDGCNRIEVTGNRFVSNGWALRLFANTTGCTLRRNAFTGNTFDLSTNGDLMATTIEGNYWDRYSGYDLDRDGVGDVPHRPLGFFALLVERVPYAMVFSRSLFVGLLDRAERVLPSLGPAALMDERPLMKAPHG